MKKSLLGWTLLLLCTGCPAEDKDGGSTTGSAPVDSDEDGYSSDVDCDDGDPSVHPEADELCDGIDNNCDGEIDPADSLDTRTWYRDSDGDQHGDPEAEVASCTAPDGHVESGEDCDDGTDTVHPDADEICDGLDNDCDGQIDPDDALDAPSWSVDFDGDGYTISKVACDEPGWTVSESSEEPDCDDRVAYIFPGAPEQCNGLDDNCNGLPDICFSVEWEEDEAYADSTVTAALSFAYGDLSMASDVHYDWTLGNAIKGYRSVGLTSSDSIDLPTHFEHYDHLYLEVSMISDVADVLSTGAHASGIYPFQLVEPFAGEWDSCWLTSVGTAWCSSDDSYISGAPTDDTFETLSVGDQHACGLRSDGSIACWGYDGSGQATPPEGTGFTQVSAGSAHTCAIDGTSQVQCWGSDYRGQSSPPETGELVMVSAGEGHTCALGADGVATCWGYDNYGQAQAPDDEIFTEVSAGDDHSCGLTEAGLSRCWGSDDYPAAAETYTFSAIEAGGAQTCGLLDDGRIRCWTRDEREIFDARPGRTYVSMTTGQTHVCAMVDDGSHECWNLDGSEFSTDTPGAVSFIAVSAEYDVCGVTEFGSVECHGTELGEPPSSPTSGASFVDIAVGFGEACALSDVGALSCWSSSHTPPSATYVAVGVDYQHGCGLTDEGVIHCWGSSSHDKTTVPEGISFTSVTVGNHHTCAMGTDDEVHCWGAATSSTPPTGVQFTAVSAGENFSCGLVDDGSVQCWGSELSGEFLPPEGRIYESISAGGGWWTGHFCAMRDDGVLECFCSDDTWCDTSPPPDQPLVQYSAGISQTCGLFDDGHIECWGSSALGNRSLPY
jgi:alpha-tubulin suppressor-like RCC1 family protein